MKIKMQHKPLKQLEQAKPVRMNLTRWWLCALLLLAGGLTGLWAQETVLAAGGEASGTGGQVSYSIGQVVYKTQSSSDGTATTGVQQAYEIWVTTAIEEAKDVHLTVSAFPNPVSDQLVLSVENLEPSKLNFQLFDMQGKLLQSKSLENNKTSIAMSNFVPSTYFVKIMQNGRELKTFKIIKN